MRNKIILNITTLCSLLLFSACSTSQKQIKPEPIAKSISIYNMMGIIPTSHYLSKKTEFIPKQRDTRETYQKRVYQESIPTNITYVSYKKESFQNNHQLQQIQDIENSAKSFLGVPYVWGATGPNKFDCSGFTQWVYRDSGINIPRVSREQARVGQFVSYENLQPGDMVFFDTKKKRHGKVTHVGIYLGNHNFIHASSAGKSVVIYNFNEKPYYKKRFLWGRRVLKPDLYYASN